MQETIIKASVVSKEPGASITNILVADVGDVDDGIIVVEDRFMDGNGNEGINFGEHKSFLWYHLFQLLVVIMLASLFLVAVFRWLNGMMSPMSALRGASAGYLWDNIAQLFYGTLLFFSSTEDAKSSRMSRKSFGSFKRSAKLFVMLISLLALVASGIVSSETELVEEGVSERRLMMRHFACSLTALSLRFVNLFHTYESNLSICFFF